MTRQRQIRWNDPLSPEEQRRFDMGLGLDPLALRREKDRERRRALGQVQNQDRTSHPALVSALLAELRAQGWYAREIRSQSIRRADGGYAPSSTKGLLDIFALKDGTCLWIDAKRGNDRLRPDQERFVADVIAHGGHALACRSVEQLRGVLEAIPQ